MTEIRNPKSEIRNFKSARFDLASFFFSGLTALATLLILAILGVILLNILLNGLPGLSWRFISTIPKKDFFDLATTGILPMIVGTTFRVLVMTIFVIPVGVITAIYLTEYAPNTSLLTRIIRAAVNNLAGVPSIVFGLFGLGFFINFIGKNLDALFRIIGLGQLEIQIQDSCRQRFARLDRLLRPGRRLLRAAQG